MLLNIVAKETVLTVSCFQYSRNRDGACCIVLPNDTEAPSLLRPIAKSLTKRYWPRPYCDQKIFEVEGVDLNNFYIDGSKFEANANKYTWVWKK